jgi:hypothetical protein
LTIPDLTCDEWWNEVDHDAIPQHVWDYCSEQADIDEHLNRP